MKAVELAMWLMQNPDADIVFMLQSNWHISLDVKDTTMLRDKMVVNLLFPEKEIYLAKQVNTPPLQ